MDQFEAAKLKHAKNLERRQRSEKVTWVEPGGCAPPVGVVNEKEEEVVTAAIVSVTVTLPSGETSFAFAKPGVSPKVTAKDIKRCIEDGLRPVLGGVKEL